MNPLLHIDLCFLGLFILLGSSSSSSLWKATAYNLPPNQPTSTLSPQQHQQQLWVDFKPHRDHIKRAILQPIYEEEYHQQQTNERGKDQLQQPQRIEKMAVLGAGNCNDIEMDSLMQWFEKVSEEE